MSGAHWECCFGSGWLPLATLSSFPAQPIELPLLHCDPLSTWQNPPLLLSYPLIRSQSKKNQSARGTGISRFSVKPLLPERSMISQLLSRVWPLLVVCWVRFRGREKSKCSFRAKQYEFLSRKLKTRKKPG